MVVTLPHSRLAPRLHIHTLLTTEGSGTHSPTWEERESALGCATVSWTSFTLLMAQLTACGITDLAERIVWHPPTVSAAETQSYLPAQTLVLKTVTAAYGSASQGQRTLVLFTGVGDYRLGRKQHRAGASLLGLRRDHVAWCSLNPAWCQPEEEYGLAAGMISPLLSPERASRSRLRAIFLLKPPPGEGNETTQVALSLSLYESLLVPSHQMVRLLEGYAQAAYPHLPLMWVEG
jgi:hypothetical protein